MWHNGLRRSSGEADERVALAVALVVRALRGGSVCVDLRDGGSAASAWPTCPGPTPTAGWPRFAPVHCWGRRRCCGCSVELLYLDRYWLEEEQVCADAARALDQPPDGRIARLSKGFSRRAMKSSGRPPTSRCRRALTVLTGGPGTGKTTTVARLLALLVEQAELAGAPRPRIALAAPTGKAAARLTEAVPPR